MVLGRTILGILAVFAAAQPLSAAGHDPEGLRPFLRAGVASTAPAIDGQDKEAFWASVVHSHPFLLTDGSGYPEERTEMAVAADTERLYLRILCSEALLDPVLQRTHEVVANAVIHDGAVHQDDHVEVVIEATGAGSGKARIAVNPEGTVRDGWVTDGRDDLAWESQVVVGAAKDTKHWCVELAIPFAALGGRPKTGEDLYLSVTRYRSADRTTATWSPSMPGRIGFGAPATGVRQQSRLAFEEGVEKWTFELQGRVPLTAGVRVRHAEYPWTMADYALEPAETAETIRIPYSLSRGNACILLDAGPDRADNTLCFRTDRLPVQGNVSYRFQVRMKTEEVVAGMGRPINLAISSYSQDDKIIKSYEQVVAAPTGTHEWQTFEGIWTAPPEAASILFWGVKWAKSGSSGKVWFDDIQLSPPDRFENVLPNGSIELTEEGSVLGWNLFSGASKADSYDRGDTVQAVCELRTAAGMLLLRSAAVPGIVTARITAIDAALLLPAGMKDSDNTYRYKELFVTEGGILSLPVVLRSSHAGRLEWADLLLDVPPFLHLLNPFPRAHILDRTTEAGRRRYRVRFGSDLISPIEGEKHTLKVTLLLLECRRSHVQAEEAVEVGLGSAIQGAHSERQVLPLTVLPPLQWRRPQVALIKHWACGSFYRDFRRLNDAERDALAHYWRQAGFNRTGAALEQDLRQRYGFSARGHIPLITAPANVFPGGMEYLAEHNEAHAHRFNGQVMKNTFCPTYFLSEQNTHLAKVREWLADHARRFPHLDWDYEVPVTRDTSICVCPRCLEAFCNARNLPVDGSVNRENIREKYREQWIDWRCRENARIGQFFREAIKQANPDCLLSIYSGYQGSTDEKYGVDWRYMSVPADLVWAGYGRPVQAILDTHKALGGRPLICGALAWFGSHPWDNRRAQTDLFRRLSDGGSGIMAYFNWIVDGRFYQAVNRVAAVVTDYEHFFRWDVDDKGFYHGRYQRADELVEVTDGGDQADVTVLLRGNERLVFVFNHTAEPRVFEVAHRQWQAGMVCLDVESRELQSQSHTVPVLPREVRIFHVREAGDAGVDAPGLLAGTERQARRQPILAWQARGPYPGGQVFDVQISSAEAFPPNATQMVSGLTETVYLPADLRPGVLHWWRVRGQDVPSGRTGPWSETGVALRSAFSEDPGAIPAFSPNGDGILDTATITAELAEPIPWQVQIRNAEEQVMWASTGTDRQVSATWDGRDARGELAPEGAYRYTVIPGGQAAMAAGGTVELNQRVGRQNPGFRNCEGFVLTVPSGSGTHAKDYAVGLGDSYSLRLEATSVATTAYWSNYASGGIGTHVIPVKAGTSFRFAARMRPELTAGEASIALAFFTADGKWAQVEGHPPWGVNSDPVTGSSSEWHLREIVLPVPDSAISAVFFFRLKDAKGKAWFDDVETGWGE